jgi:GDA1/CD39 (nucleoside phosphatase) family
LHNRCLEALYMTTLLEHGFGFDSSHRNITLALEVMGHEVEWTLGFALAEVPLPQVEIVRSEKKSHSLRSEMASLIRKCIATCSGALERIKSILHFILGRS